MSHNLNTKVIKATKWSSITEIAAKLVAPVSTMILARVLTPDAFGILVMATMIISFADIFTDAGFQKYIIQHEFQDKDSLFASVNVAFISNLIVSIVLWVVIIIFSDQIAQLVGSPGYGMVISISSACLPLTAFSSIQMALFKRNFDFKTLFIVRIVGVSIPLVITIPLAFIFRSYWALIIGMIALNLSNALILTIKSVWKPKLWYNWNLFKGMFSFTFWSMLESIMIWATSYSDIFIVGKLLNDYYLGIYRTSMTTVGQIIGLITAATTPVLFSTLSRLQSDANEFEKMFFRFQKIIAILVVPLGTLMYIFRDLTTEILLGPQWGNAAYFIGLWALTSSITVVLAHYSSEVYRAKGKPKLSVIVQLSHIACLIPIILWAVPHGFNFLCEWRAIIRLELILANLLIMYIFIKISPISMIKNILPSIFAAVLILLISNIFPKETDIWMRAIYILPCFVIYFGILCLFPKDRKIILNFKTLLKK